MTAVLLALALAAPSSFVALDEVDPTILQDMRYATAYNFVGRPIDGYREPVCILTRRAARALERARTALEGYTLKVYDCYRPQRAVDHFARWERNDSRTMKREFYPRVSKRLLFDEGYLAHRSGHSRGSTVDLTLVELPAKEQPTWSRSEFGPLVWLASLDLEFVGFAIVGLFVLTWGLAVAVWRFGRIEEKWSAADAA